MNKYYKDFLHKAADRVFYWWEEYKYEDQGLGDWDKVCQFADYIDTLDDEDLASLGRVYYDGEDTSAVDKLRSTITKAINKWLGIGEKQWFEQ